MCAPCQEYGATSELFSGLMIYDGNTPHQIYSPYQAYVTGNILTFRDWRGNVFPVDLECTEYDSMFQLITAVSECACPQGDSGEGSIPGGDGNYLIGVAFTSLTGGNIKFTLYDGSSIILDASRFFNTVSEVPNIAARNVIPTPGRNYIAIIADADGNGTPGISFWNGSAWTTPFLQGSGGSGGGISLGMYNLPIGSNGSSVQIYGTAGIAASISGGTVDIIVGAGMHLIKGSIEIDTADMTYTDGMYVQQPGLRVRIDNSANQAGRQTGRSINIYKKIVSLPISSMYPVQALNVGDLNLFIREINSGGFEFTLNNLQAYCPTGMLGTF